MESTLELKSTNVTAKSNTVAQTGWYARLLDKLNFNYFGLISVTIAAGSIIGGIAAMYIFQNGAEIWQLAICMMGAMANNVCAIGQAPTKWVANVFALTTILNIILILVNL